MTFDLTYALNTLSGDVSFEQERQYMNRSTTTDTERAAIHMAAAALEMARKAYTPLGVAEKLIEQGHAALWLCGR